MSNRQTDRALDALWDADVAASVRSWRSLIQPVAAGSLALTVFAVDTLTSLSGAVAVLYCLVPLIASEGRSRSAILWSGGICLTLALGSFALNHGLTPDAGPDFRFLFSVAALLTSVTLLLSNVQARRRQKAQACLLDLTTDAIVLRTYAGVVLLWNRGAEALYGWPAEAILGSDHHHVLETRFENHADGAEATLLGTGYWTGELEQRRRDGTDLSVTSRWRLLRGSNGAPWGILETSTDVTARRAAETGLQQSERRYRGIFETLAVGILEYDLRAVKSGVQELQANGALELARLLDEDPAVVAELRAKVRVVDANPAALRMFANDERDAFLANQPTFLPISDEDFVRCLVALEGSASMLQFPVRYLDGGAASLSLIFAMRIPDEPDAFDRVHVSVTDLTRVELLSNEIAGIRSDLDQAMRTAAIAEVSATIAHEVNQPLAAIRTNASAARRWLERDIANADEALIGVLEAVDRASLVVKRVRTLFDKGASNLAPVSVDEMIRATLRLIAREVSEAATNLTLELAADDARVLGNPLLLQQSIMSLAINALQAMGGTPADARKLYVRSEKRGSSIIVTISDTGPGFPREILDLARDGLFHTRQGGMGLGLAICRSTILSIGGDIAFSNDAETGGAIARLTLPMEAGTDAI